MPLTDLFGQALTGAAGTRRNPPAIDAIRVLRERRASRALQAHLRQPNLVLFDEVLAFLAAPLVAWTVPAEYRTDCLSVPAHPQSSTEEQAPSDADPPIADDPWGPAWITDRLGQGWSKASIDFLQVRLFWRSLEELALSNNEHEKWSVLKWMYRPAIWRYYVWDRRIQRSHALLVHEADEPFTFHNCCIAARMDEDVIREGVRRHCPADLIEAVARVVRV